MKEALEKILDSDFLLIVYRLSQAALYAWVAYLVIVATGDWFSATIQEAVSNAVQDCGGR